MGVNKGLLFLGILLAIVAVAGMFFIGQLMNPEPAVVVVANVDIEPGTKLADMPDGSLSRGALRGDANLVGSYVTVEKYGQLAQAGAIFVQRLTPGEAIPLGAILSSDNPAARQYTALLLDDPKMVALTLDAKDIAPKGVRAGDMVDIAVAVDNVRDQNVQEDQQSKTIQSMIPSTTTVIIDGTPVPAPNNPSVPTNGQPAAAPTPTQEPYIVPIAKTIVKNAYVLNVIREEKNSTGVDGTTRVIYGNVTGLTVIVPRDSFEWVTMANSAGKIRLALLSPLAKDDNKPTMGASLQDLIKAFYNDRATLVPQPTAASAQPTNPPAPVQPTVAPTATAQP